MPKHYVRHFWGSMMSPRKFASLLKPYNLNFGLVEDILGDLYAQLKKLEPDNSACVQLHLCDASCIVPGFNTEAPIQPTKVKMNVEVVDTAKLIQGIAKLQHLAFSLSYNHTEPLYIIITEKKNFNNFLM
ncbi:Protein CBG25677 [Caenorhabditis briggsae]|uniref:Protein CBG25677 n=1 Tax=Caenorhabditis briggsae TaxID=6238 RepID=B6ILM2_CAEBR|nr:Protein CBG25677 [Caenorhabditis briggsae]CAS00802.1 Protein CBG25677 [Caenorhabditis briggsae]